MPVRHPSRVARVAVQAVPDGEGTGRLAVVVPGTGGAAAVVDAVVERLSARSTPVLRVTGRRLESDVAFGAIAHLTEASPVDGGTGERAAAHRDALLATIDKEGAALVVADAHWLDEASLRAVVGVAERADDLDTPVVVTHRPVAGHAQLAALDAALGRGRPVVALGALDESEVGELAALVLGNAVEDQLVEAVHDLSGGMPDLVELLLGGWVAAGVVTGGRLAAAPPPPDASLVAGVRSRVDELAPRTRTVLEALSAGAELDDHLLGAATGIDPDLLGDAVDELRAAGLLLPGPGEVVPLVAAAVDAMTPVADRRGFHARLAAALDARRAPATVTGEHLAAAGAQGPDAAAAYVAAGDATLADAPELASGWYDRAIAAGTPAPELAARRAEAAALLGDASAALRLADRVVADRRDPERGRALAVVAALLPGRGYWSRAAGAYAELARLAPGAAGDGASGGDAAAWPVLADIAALVSGRSDGSNGSAAAGGAPSPAESPLGGLETEALGLTRDGLRATAGPAAGASLASLVEASELLESAHHSVLLPTTPHVVGAAVALAVSEPSAADHLLSRATERAVGGAMLQRHHQLAAGLVALRSGRWAAAQSALDDVADVALAPREALTASAIDAGLARRGGDLARLTDAWARAEGVLLRHKADLLCLDAVGELAIAAARLGLWDRVAPKARELGDVVRALGEPPLWLLPLRWIGLQVALATDDREAAVRRAAEVEATTPVHPRLAALGEAARCWVAVLGGSGVPGEVATASAGLAALGLTWEASRLTGQAAIRSSDPTVTRQLLEQARDLKAALPTADRTETATAVSVLSEREQMVAHHIVDGLTHKEIGAQLYISPKTVEHHVAKIRQKLGASTRAEMLAALRTHLAS